MPEVGVAEGAAEVVLVVAVPDADGDGDDELALSLAAAEVLPRLALDLCERLGSAERSGLHSPSPQSSTQSN